MNKCIDWAAKDPLLLAYHDHRWCRPCHDDREIFAMLCLEGQQAGLSWSIILRKEVAIRTAFKEFDIDAVAAFDEKNVEELLHNRNIIRNKAKILAAIQNAKAVRRLTSSGEYSSLDSYIWHFTDGKQIVHHLKSFADMPAKNALSETVSKDMRQRHFSFVGPVICYSWMQGIGVIDDHLDGCPCKAADEAKIMNKINNY